MFGTHKSSEFELSLMLHSPYGAKALLVTMLGISIAFVGVVAHFVFLG